MQDMVVVCLIVEELSNINIKCVKYRSRSPGQGTCQTSRMTMQSLMAEGLIFEEISNINVKCVSHWSAKYMSRSPGQGTCQIEKKHYTRFGGWRPYSWGDIECRRKMLRTWKGDIKGVKVNGARNIGQGHRVKVPAESVHWEALCKVWWL